MPSPSPTKESLPAFVTAHTTDLLPPPSPRTHRALRKLQSAHNLGSKAASGPSLIAQQRLHQRNISPTRRDLSSPTAHNTRSPARGRANSDATSLGAQVNPMAANKRGMLSLNPKYAQVPLAQLIRNDTFRTLTTDPLFRRRVSEASLIRLLNAIAWKLHDAREAQRLKDRPPTRDSIASSSSAATPTTRPSTSHSRPQSSGQQQQQQQQQNLTSSPAAKHRARALTLTTEGSSTDPALASEPGTYVQGMNVLAAPFLYAARSEGEAFVALHTLLTRECPGYIRGAMDGVHKGLALVDRVLATVDSRLSGHLLAKGLTAELYAFPSVLTLCACTPPLPEVLRLWDFLFAYGPHLNILCIVAQLMGMRDQLLNSPSPNRLLRAFPSLQADKVIERTLWIIERIPDDTYAAIVTHAL
ncbi:Cell division control protein 16 like [Verticillium longisporum]|uniref:Cell division control protein 16 like n=1 Tax=Verticillium longisporum TaxID=100787 RepID=A0A8I2ZCZ7_VERLO|nr:Cell division control protein 16 like [Verticillium longisporum]